MRNLPHSGCSSTAKRLGASGPFGGLSQLVWLLRLALAGWCAVEDSRPATAGTITAVPSTAGTLPLSACSTCDATPCWGPVLLVHVQRLICYYSMQANKENNQTVCGLAARCPPLQEGALQLAGHGATRRWTGRLIGPGRPNGPHRSLPHCAGSACRAQPAGKAPLHGQTAAAGLSVA